MLIFEKERPLPVVEFQSAARGFFRCCEQLFQGWVHFLEHLRNDTFHFAGWVQI
jgi:hypothetical protein